MVIINTAKQKTEIKINLPPKNIYVIDATKIALEEIGRNIVNTVILGAFARVTGLVSLESLKKAVLQKFADKPDLADKNIKAVEKAYNL